MLLRNAWYIGAWADEIGGEQPLARRICNDPIVLFRDGTGRVAALAGSRSTQRLHNRPRFGNAQIGLPNMHTACVHQHRDIGAIVHDEAR